MHDKTGARTLRDDIEELGRVKKAIAGGACQGVPPFHSGGRFKVLPKRWIVERTFAWRRHFRRPAKDYEKTLHMAKAMILMSAVVITLRKPIT